MREALICDRLQGHFFLKWECFKNWKTAKKLENFASAGNRTRAARVAGEHSTTEPPMLARRKQFLISIGLEVTKLYLSTWFILDISSFVCLHVILWLWKQSICETSQIAMCFRFSCAFIHFHSKFPNNTPPPLNRISWPSKMCAFVLEWLLIWLKVRCHSFSYPR